MLNLKHMKDSGFHKKTLPVFSGTGFFAQSLKPKTLYLSTVNYLIDTGIISLSQLREKPFSLIV